MVTHMGFSQKESKDLQRKIELQLQVINALKDVCVVSGGMAWHLMSEEHEEVYHDHKDVDILVCSPEVIGRLKEMGFTRQWTKYGNEKFVRYTKYVPEEGKTYKIMFDVFFEKPPYVVVEGIKVVHPKTLASYYRSNRWVKNKEILKKKFLKMLD